MSIDWRASLVPAAAVIPAPIAYIKVVAVKKLVVGSGGRSQRLLLLGMRGAEAADRTDPRGRCAPRVPLTECSRG